MIIIGKSLTALGGGGLKPEITVTSKAGALLNLHYKGSSIILQTYQLGEAETQHTFVVGVSETAYVIEDATNGETVEALVDSVAQYRVEISYWHGELFYLGDEYTNITGGYTCGSGYSLSNDGTDFIFQRSGADQPAVRSANFIDFTDYTILKCLIRWKAGKDSVISIGMSILDTSGSKIATMTHNWLSSSSGEILITLDITNVDYGQFDIGINQYSTLAISKLWCE